MEIDVILAMVVLLVMSHGGTGKSGALVKDNPLIGPKGEKISIWDLDFKKDRNRCEEVIILAREDKLFWLYEAVKTKDQVDKKTPIKRFPRLDYIEYFVRHVYPYEKLIFLPKSRRMTITWLITALMTAEWWSRTGYAGFIQSKKALDALELVERCWFIYNGLPEWMKFNPSNLVVTRDPAKIEHRARHSWLWGIPQGPDQLRQYTASQILFDEAAFQDRFREAWTAAKPTLEGGGQAFVVSTSNGPVFFHDLVFDMQHITR